MISDPRPRVRSGLAAPAGSPDQRSATAAATSAGPARTVGIVGVGHMGTPLAANLARAGMAVLGFDLDPARRMPGSVTRAATFDELLRASDLLVLSLPDAAVVAEVVRDVVSAAHNGLTRVAAIADTSTIGPAAATAASAALADAGVEYADAAVSGGVAGAEKRAVSVMFAGSAQAHELLAPVLAAISDRVYRVGDSPGLGQAVKVANNFLSATALCAASEAVGMLASVGVDPHVAITVINASSGMSRATQDKFPEHILTERYASGFSSRLMAKDVRLYLDEAAAAGAAQAVGSVVAAVWDDFAAGEPDTDFTRIFAFVNALGRVG